MAISNKQSQVYEPSAAQDNKLFVEVKLDVSSYRDLGGEDVLSDNFGEPQNVYAVADTGATDCCAPWWMAGKLGVTLSNTFESSSSMFAADGRKLNIKGFLPIVFSAHDSDGRKIFVKEIIYIVKGLKEVFISQKVLKALGSLTPEFPIPVAEGDNKALNVDQDISIAVDSPKISKDSPKENKLRRRREAKLRKKLEGTKDVVKKHDREGNNSQLKEASATQTSILSKYSEKLVNKDKIDANGGEIVDIADVVKKDDGPGESDVELAKVAPLHCFPSGLQT